MKTIKEQILEAIQKQSLSSADLRNWRITLEDLPEELCGDILKFIENKSDGLRILTGNLNKKIDALEKKDAQKWEEVLEEEKRLFQAGKL